MSDNDYDERTCITAQELRACGLPIPNSIPDAAWVRRDAIKWEAGHASAHPDGKVVVSCFAKFVSPFRWIEVDVTVGER